jgi:hypothetical protein
MRGDILHGVISFRGEGRHFIRGGRQFVRPKSLSPATFMTVLMTGAGFLRGRLYFVTPDLTQEQQREDKKLGDEVRSLRDSEALNVRI